MGLLDLKFSFSILASIITLLGYYPYLKDTVAGKSKPHMYSWLIWSLTQMTNVYIVLKNGLGGFALISFLSGVLCVIITLLISFKKGTKDITTSDKTLLFLALVAIFLLWQTKSLLPSLLLVCFIDGAGYIPTIRKTFVDPGSESMIFWAMMNVGNMFTLLAIDKYSPFNTLYLAVMIIGNGLIFAISFWRRKPIQQI